MRPQFKREERKRTLPQQADYQAMVARRKRQIVRVCNRLGAGELSPAQWADAFHAILVQGHADAWMLGRQRAGDLSPRSSLDDLAGSAIADGESEHLNDFLAKLEDPAIAARDGGLYDLEGNLKLGKVKNRAQSYLGKMRATAAESFVEAGDDDELYDWVLGAVEEHCPDCPQWAAMSPFMKGTLPLYPGDGTTPCKGNCYCHLVRRSDGRTAFTA